MLRCLGNVLACGACEAAGCPAGVEDARLLAALCVFSQTYLTSHCALSRESLWVLNNLTGSMNDQIKIQLNPNCSAYFVSLIKAIIIY